MKEARDGRGCRRRRGVGLARCSTLRRSWSSHISAEVERRPGRRLRRTRGRLQRRSGRGRPEVDRRTRGGRGRLLGGGSSNDHYFGRSCVDRGSRTGSSSGDSLRTASSAPRAEPAFLLLAFLDGLESVLLLSQARPIPPLVIRLRRYLGGCRRGELSTSVEEGGRVGKSE